LFRISLTGEIGVGKMTLLRAVLERLPEGTDVVVVFNTAGLSPLDLLRLIAADLGPDVSAESKSDFIMGINSLLLRRLPRAQNTVLVIDEAQNLSPEALEEVRLLSNLETEAEKLLQIVLTGQPELRRMLSTPELRAIRQRIALEHHVEPLRPDDIRPYLSHCIRVAGGQYDTLFGPGAEEVFYAASRGYPRVINLLADRALLAAYAKPTRPVPQELLEAKARQLEGIHGGSGASLWGR
jgi:general secretion pathway protein A